MLKRTFMFLKGADEKFHLLKMLLFLRIIIFLNAETLFERAIINNMFAFKFFENFPFTQLLPVVCFKQKLVYSIFESNENLCINGKL